MFKFATKRNSYYLSYLLQLDIMNYGSACNDEVILSL